MDEGVVRHLDLFSGIGGFALAARRVGWETVGFCEIDPYCQKVLAKHWPGVPIYEDVKTIVADPQSDRRGPRWARGVAINSENGPPTETTFTGPVDIITGGFPCQDISYAGKGAGIEGERSGLWTELARIIGDIRPRWAVLENVAALLGRGLDRVAGDLAEIGYDCEWHCIPASAVGAPHRRDRIWIVAYPQKLQCNGGNNNIRNSKQQQTVSKSGNSSGAKTMADTNVPRLEGRLRKGLQECASQRTSGQGGGTGYNQWAVESDVGRVANGIPRRMDRLRGLGNAVVPQIPKILFRAINEIENIRSSETLNSAGLERQYEDQTQDSKWQESS